MPTYFNAIKIRLLLSLNAFLVLPIVAGHEAKASGPPPAELPHCQSIVRANIVAFEQSYLLNRFGAFVPAGMMYALRHDVVSLDGESQLRPGRVRLRPDKRPRPLVLRVNEGECLEVTFQNLLRPDAREEGGVLPDHGGGLPGHTASLPGEAPRQPRVRLGPVSIDPPRTRAASFHVTGLELAHMEARECPIGLGCGGDGSNVGRPGHQGLVFHPDTPASVRQGYGLGSLAAPGQTVVTRWRAEREGAYFAYSTAAPVGGEGDGGQIGLGLFASVNVEPVGARWYRSQVTTEELRQGTGSVAESRHEYAVIDYSADHPTRRLPEGDRVPLFRMRDAHDRIMHSDLNAIIVLPDNAAPCDNYASGCSRSFREFTVILHDEVAARQAFAELEDENNPLSKIRDGMGINYGASSMGALVLASAPHHAVAPLQECTECRAEEFFLSSWAAGDPALILAYDGNTPSGARWADDPSNVHHSYLGDAVRFRNLHAGPKETHVFHLHAHQWLMDPQDPDSSYLDSQTISPGATFSYGIGFGGSGNRNYTPGDSIFHCHLYPHFAQGMWELWRVHDTFEDGRLGPRWYDPQRPESATENNPRWRNLPDAQIAAGTPTPALLPIPGSVLAPLPGEAFPGYPHYIAGAAGHRPPQPALDMDVIEGTGWNAASGTAPPAEAIINGGLPRHVVGNGSTLERGLDVVDRALSRGGAAAQVIARRVSRQADAEDFAVLAREWNQIELSFRAHAGEPVEQRAMTFHEGTLEAPGLRPVDGDPPRPGWWPGRRAYRTDRVNSDRHANVPGDPLFFVNGLPRAPGAPFANPCPVGAPERHYRAAFIQTELTYNRHGWFDPQGRIIVLEDDIHHIIDPNTRTRLPEPLFFRANSGECIVFRSTNLVPSLLNVDDFQIITPTDTIGQHIHLVKFDVTSSDGSGNGWNYEDGTFSPEEVRERIFAYNRTLDRRGSAAPRLAPQAHPLFRPGGTIWEAASGDVHHRVHGELLRRGLCPAPNNGEVPRVYEDRLRKEHPYCGAQRTTQRWWADPVLSTRRPGRDNTLRTVFTHDHFGPSSHQQHGLYAGLVIEPANALWVRTGERPLTPTEVDALRGPDPAAPRLPMTLAEQQVCRDRAESLARGEADMLGSDADTPLRARCKLLGGSDLTMVTAPELRRDRGHVLAPLEPRTPLVLRGDGGPTATMADIVAPACVRDGNSVSQRNEDNEDVPLVPARGLTPREGAEPPCVEARQNRREFTVALADFGIAYTAALEPVNPEPLGDAGFRDNTALRFGRRHVATTLARPLAISSEDPGSQFVNYRHEPLALRISEATPDPVLGGFNYRQSRERAGTPGADVRGTADALGDPANGFSSRVHAQRDLSLATAAQPVAVHRQTRVLLHEPEQAAMLDRVLRDVEQWRRDFNCALYSAHVLPAWGPGTDPARRGALCDPRIDRREAWRLPGDPATPIPRAHDGDRIQVRLIQGAQEAQHIFTMNGVRWRRVPDSARGGLVSAQPIGISEHFEGDINIFGFGSSMPDYLYSSASVDQIWDGLWGILRVTANIWEPSAVTAAATPRERTDRLVTARQTALAGTGIARRMERLRDAVLESPPTRNGAPIAEPEASRIANVAAQIVVPALAAAVGNGSAAPALPPGLAALARQLTLSPAGPTALADQLAAEQDVLRIARAMVLPASTNPLPRRDRVVLPRRDRVVDQESAVCSREPGTPLVHRRFDISAVQVCALYGDCGAPRQSGIEYSRRFGIRDDRAIIYVLNRAQRCDAANPEPGCGTDDGLTNAEVLSRLRSEFRNGRPIEPLVMRAPAGACLQVTLRNHLPSELDDGPPIDTHGDPQVAEERRAYHNFLPMITDGFNINQFRMSSTVGLSAPRLSQNPLHADGTNLGWNGLRLDDEVHPQLWTQGSLVQPCGTNAGHCGDSVSDGGMRTFFWSATDLTPSSNLPAEFGALPLRSFGDPVKHPMHGLVGALVIGPAGSDVCADDRFIRPISVDGFTIRLPAGISAEICGTGGLRYVDHVLVVQDAVNATRGGLPVPNLSGAEEPDDYGVKALNYRTEPLWARSVDDPSVGFEDRNQQVDYATILSSRRRADGLCAAGMPPIPGVLGDQACDPETPILRAHPGEEVRLHFVHPGGHTRQQGFAVSGHGWSPFPWLPNPADPEGPPVFDRRAGSFRVGVTNGFGPMMGVTYGFRAGGGDRIAMDYLIRSQASFLFDGGLWGLLRVQDPQMPQAER